MSREDKIETLVGYIERWMNENPRRSLSLLSRYTGIPYPTLRRIVQKESQPSVENALYLLNFVASVPETLDYFGDDTAIKNFYKRVTNDQDIVNDLDYVEKLLKRESCWITILALTVGATKENVDGLLGSHGIAELNALIEEKFLYEERPGVWKTDGNCFQQYIESIKVGVTVSRYIAELPPQEDSLFRFFAGNIPAEKFPLLKKRCQEIFEELSMDVKSSDGDTLVAGSIIFTRVLDGERKSK